MVSMRRSISIAAALLAGMLLAGAAIAQTQPPPRKLKVLATFSILADFATNVGGERVEVTMLVGRNGDAHVYAPAPADAKKVADASVVLVNELGFEGWMDRLSRAAGGKAPVVVASRGVTPRTLVENGRGEADPHAWQSVANAKIYVANIRDAFVAADPAGKEAYQANAAAYLAKLDALDKDVRAAVAAVPAERRKVISTHDAFGYFQDAYGIRFIAPQGVSTESEPSARDVARIISQVKAQKIPAVFLENVSDPRLMQQIARETGARIGGTLYSDALTDAAGEAPTYIDLVRHNVRQMTSALMS
jgi:zinc/manganese transport system substrate-binding protein